MNDTSERPPVRSRAQSPEVAPGSEPLPECLVCGACCFSRLDAYAPVTGADHARLGDRAGELVTFLGNRAYLRMVDDRCAALTLVPATGELVCSAYALRPDVCRALERGSAECLGERAAKADRPRAALAAP